MNYRSITKSCCFKKFKKLHARDKILVRRNVPETIALNLSQGFSLGPLVFLSLKKIKHFRSLTVLLGHIRVVVARCERPPLAQSLQTCTGSANITGFNSDTPLQD